MSYGTMNFEFSNVKKMNCFIINKKYFFVK